MSVRVAGQRPGRKKPGLLAPGTPINRDTLEEAVERAALACARGPVQAAAVTSLIETGSISASLEWNTWARTEVPTFGRYSLTWGSWSNLKKRLELAGFEVRKVKVRFKQGREVGWRWDVYWKGTGE